MDGAKAYFSRVSGSYDRDMVGVFRIERELIARSARYVRNDRRILDACTGTGLVPSALRPLVAAEIYGVDFSARMVSAAKSKGIPGCRFVCCDVAAMPFKDRFFDSSFCFFGIPFLADLGAALQELARVTDRRILILVRDSEERPKGPARAFWRRVTRTELSRLLSRSGFIEERTLQSRSDGTFSLAVFRRID